MGKDVLPVLAGRNRRNPMPLFVGGLEDRRPRAWRPQRLGHRRAGAPPGRGPGRLP